MRPSFSSVTTILVIICLLEGKVLPAEAQKGTCSDDPEIQKEISQNKLTNQNYESWLKNNPKTVIFFHLPSEQSMLSFTKIFKKIRREVEMLNLDYKYAYVDASKQTEIIESLGLDDFPAIQIFYQEVPIHVPENLVKRAYEGVSELIREFHQAKVHSFQHLEDLKLEWKNALFYFNTGNTHFDSILLGLAGKYHKEMWIFKVSTHAQMKEIAGSFGFDLEPNVNLIISHRKADNTTLFFEEGISVANMIKFIDETIMPQMLYLTEQNYNWMAQERLSMLILFYSNIDLNRDKIISFKSASLDLDERAILPVIADMNQDFVKEYCAKHGLSDFNWSLFIVKPFLTGEPKYLFQGKTINQETLIDFVLDFKNKGLKKFYKSELPVVHPRHQLVRVLVGSEFTKTVVENVEIHCVVFFYDSQITSVDFLNP